MYVYCLLKNTSTKHHKYVVNKKHEHFDNIIVRERFGRIIVSAFFLQNEICLFLAHCICFYVGYSFS
jgi:hypothetical protein